MAKAKKYLNPAPNYILVTQETQEEVTEGGIYLPEKSADVPQTGIVALDGEGFKKGTKVWFKKWAGEDILYNKINYKILHIKDIIASEI